MNLSPFRRTSTTEQASAQPVRRLRTVGSSIVALAIAASGLTGLVGHAGAATAPVATAVDPVTDNYKAKWNADPTVPELRTWLALKGLTVGGVTYRPAVVPAAITTSAAANGLALKGSDNSTAVLTARTTSTNVFHQGFFRVDPTGTFGLLQQLKAKVTPTTPLNEKLTLTKAGVVIGEVDAVFTYDAAIAAAPTTNIEFNGPGGRWFVGGVRTRLDWEPVVTPPAGFTVAVPVPASTTPGSTISSTWTVTNSGGTASRAYAKLGLTQNVSKPGARLVSAVPSQGSCSVATASCDLGSIAGGAKATVTVTLDVLSIDAFTLELTASVTAGGVGGKAGISPVVTGKSCTIIGTSGADTLVGDAGSNVICGFGGNDTVRPGGGDDTVHGGAGSDTVSYSGQATGVVVNLAQKSAWDIGTAKNIGWDVFTGIENAHGTSSADKLLGDPAANVLTGIAGNDEMYGYDGNDTLSGGAGTDKLYGGNGDDAFDGGTESDLCQQNAGTGTKVGCETA